MKRSGILQWAAVIVFACAILASQGCPKRKGVATAVVPGVPTITTQPSSQTVSAGNPVTFTVIATGSGNTYQWRKGGVNIGGATSASYTIAATVAGDAGNYDVVITNPSGSVTSNTAVLTVNVAGFPAITTQPTNQSVTAPATATFTVVATGTGPLTYQWYRGAGTGTPVGTNSATYTTAATSVGADNGAQFHVVVSNGLGSVDSNLVTLTVTAPTAATIVTQPTNVSVVEPATATFTVVAGGGGPYTYQWYRGAGTGTPVGTNSASYTTAATSVAADNGAQFHVVVTNAGGSIDSNLVTLTVTAPYNGNPITVSASNLTLPTAASPSSVKVSGTLTLTNTSGLPVTVTLTGGAAWLSGSPTPVTIPGGGTQVITVTGDPAVGSGTANLTLTNSPGSLNQTVAVTFTVSGTSTATAAVASAFLDAAISGAVTLDGSATTGAATYQWTQIAGPTVTLTGATTNTASFTAPATVPARSLKFQLEAKPASGPSSFAIVTVTVYESTTRVIYVDSVNGNDANTFTGSLNSKANPMQTLAAAITDSDNNSGASGRPDIVMASGTYNIAPGATTGIQLFAEISIYGGFNNTAGVWTRDVAANTTSIVDTRSATGSLMASLDASNQSLAAVTYDGFKITGPTNDYAVCVITNRTATYRNVTFVGGTANAGSSECIRIQSAASAPVFQNCTFTLGTSTAGAAIGVYLQPIVGSTSTATLTNCTFGGGSATGSVSYVDRKNDTVGAPALTITGCTFLGTGTGGTGSCSAIFIERSSATISGCDITPPPSTAWSVGVWVYNRDTATPSNNTGATTTISNCAINGGVGASSSIGIWYSAGPIFCNAALTNPLTVTNCFISGGNGPAENVGITAEMFTGATALTGTATLQALIQNCTIDAGYHASADVTGIHMNGMTGTQGCKLSINNNILFTRKTGATGAVKLIAENVTGSPDAPEELQNNLFFIDTAYTGTFPAYYYLRPTGIGPTPNFSMPLTSATEIDAAITSPIATKAGNINLTTTQGVANSTVFAFTSPFNYHLKAGCPAVDAGLNAGAPAIDIDGDTRPGGSTVDIGADEN